MWENHVTNLKISKTCILQLPIAQIPIGMARFLRATVNVTPFTLRLFQISHIFFLLHRAIRKLKANGFQSNTGPPCLSLDTKNRHFSNYYFVVPVMQVWNDLMWVNDDKCFISEWTNLFRQIQLLSLLIPVALLLTLRDGAGLWKTCCWPTPWLRTITVCVHVCIHACVLVMTWGCKFLQSCPVWDVCKSLFFCLSLWAISWTAAQFYHRASFQKGPYCNRKDSFFTGLGWSAWEGGIKSRKMGGEEGEIR